MLGLGLELELALLVVAVVVVLKLQTAQRHRQVQVATTMQQLWQQARPRCPGKTLRCYCKVLLSASLDAEVTHTTATLSYPRTAPSCPGTALESEKPTLEV